MNMNRFVLHSIRQKNVYASRQLSGFISVNNPIPINKKSLTKIVATIGPKSEQLPDLTKVVDAGMKIMRINFSHATYEEADLRAGNIYRVFEKTAKSNEKNLLAVMLDTQGPEIRTGMFANDVKELELVMGNLVTLSTRAEIREKQTEKLIWISYNDLPTTARIGTAILLDDGAIELIVEKIDTSAGELVCRIANTGVLGNKKGVNIPGGTVNLPAMSEKDERDIKWGIENDIDFIAASFVRKASDVTAIREYTRKLLIAKYGPNATSNHPTPRIISKIESTEALVNFDEILAVSDAIMVARGDLGIEIPMECVANVQKEIVAKSNLAGRPVVVATQMLESMQKNPRPTRAECTDVYNAVLDGADCVMLSGESAKGKYPSQSVGTMKKIVDQAELWTHANPNNVVVVSTKPKILDPDHGFAYGIVEASKNINASCIISIVRTGITAENISFYRPNVPIVTVVPNAKLGRLLQLHRGIHPIIAPENLTSTSKLSLHDRCEIAVREAKQAGFCKSGDHVVLSVTDTASQNISRAKTMRVITVL